ncbi:three-helix bundle dimerization domain-containing protein [Pseudarthrobacter sp. NPDC092424]|uniref:three-helix bundle dimerization domain-containing protein n=1 Tax=Pseudarthrobacter sp. NPDC092424 TaxID=3364415 RepID=UPI0037FD6071
MKTGEQRRYWFASCSRARQSCQIQSCIWGWTPRNSPNGVIEELRALGHVVDRLAEKYPDLPREHIEVIVEQEHRSLDSGRVRDYVPILVEHAVRDRLRE